MRVSEGVLKQIEQAAAEGRVTEGGKAVLPGLTPPPLKAEADEKSFQQAVVDLAKKNGWLVYHTYDSRKSTAGFPDLVLVRERVLWLELKVHPNKPTAEQLRWIDALKAAGQWAWVLYPEEWANVVNLLEGKS